MSIEEVIKAAVMNDPEPQESQEDEIDLEQEFQDKDKVVFEFIFTICEIYWRMKYLYAMKEDGSDDTVWSEPINVGEPINSAKFNDCWK